jgi:hypothetical protein
MKIMSEARPPVKSLGELLARKGVPPFILAANIYDPAYRSVRLWKEDGVILVETVCDDPDYDEPMVFLYRYSQDKILLRIDATVCGRTTPYFDRKDELNRLAKQFMSERQSGGLACDRAAVTGR